MAAVVLLAGAVELLLPQSGARGYGRAVLGLLVLLTVLRPVLGWLEGAQRVSNVIDHAALAVDEAGSTAPAASWTAAPADATAQLVADLATELVHASPGGSGAAVSLWLVPSAEANSAPQINAVRVVLVQQASPAERAHLIQGLADALGVSTSRITVVP